MASRQLQGLVDYLRTRAAVGQAGRLTDAELLERFVRARDGAAFEVLVLRHGPVVMHVCRNVTRRAEDAEDAFQATFFALARKAHAIERHAAVGSWLYKVAYRAALEVARQPVLLPVGASPQEPTAAPGPEEEAIGRELQAALAEEVGRLPEKYRRPLVLCCLEGRTNREVAEQLHCPEATLRTRLARARERLRTRLARRGLGVSAGILTAALSVGPGWGASPRLVAATLDAALGLPGPAAAGAGSVAAAVIAEKVLKAMFLQTVKLAAAALVMVGVLGSAATVSVQYVLAHKTEPGLSPAPVEQLEAPADRPADDRTAIIGTWESTETVTRFVNSGGVGKSLPPEQLKVRWVITADKLINTNKEGFIDQEWSYRLDPAANPKAIDLTSRRLGTVPAIYRLDENVLTICHGLDGKRPTAFPEKTDHCWVLRKVSAEPAQVAQRYPNAPGCFWMVEPSSPAVSMHTLGINYFFEKGPEGAVVTLSYAFSATGGDGVREYRPVLLDAAGKRHVPQHIGGGYSGGRGTVVVALHRWRMDPKVLPADKVTQIGIEAVTAESTRLAGREAAEHARKAGVEVLPWPEVGKNFPFTLTTLDGQTLRSSDLKGKVVVLDCWASWCGPCLAKMPELKRCYERWRKEGLEVIGVSLERDAGRVPKVCRAEGIPWPQVLVPTDETTRALWQAAAGIESIPRVFLLDRQGRLRADTPGQLEEEIGKLLKEGVSR